MITTLSSEAAHVIPWALIGKILVAVITALI